jgi:hypothetical protein
MKITTPLQRMGGYVVTWPGNISYLTIRGSGHMVPEYKPAATLAFISDFVKGDEYKRYVPKPKPVRLMCKCSAVQSRSGVLCSVFCVILGAIAERKRTTAVTGAAVALPVTPSHLASN